MTSQEGNTLTECISMFMDRFQGRIHTQKRTEFAKFVGVAYDSAMNWVRYSKDPSGDKRWRAIVFFHMLGYQLPEYYAWNATYRGAVKMLAFGLLNSVELGNKFGFDGIEPVSAMNRILSGRRILNAESFNALCKYIDENTDLIVAAEEEFKQSYMNMSLLTFEESEPLEEDSVSSTEASVVSSGEIHIVALKLSPETSASMMAGLMTAMLPLAEYLVSDACTAENRQQMRALTKKGSVFELSNLLSDLCGERARNNTRGD